MIDIVEKRFEIDTAGFKIQMASVKPFRVVQEIISNSFDEDTATTITCEIKQINNKQIEVTITDDGDGFKDIKDVYTMYKYSTKRNNTAKRGRFNLGEKQFFVLAETGYVKTANQMVQFKNDTRTTSQIDHPKSTIVNGIFNWKGQDMKDILLKMHKLIVPEGKTLLVNDTPVKAKSILKKFKCALPTQIEDADKVLRRVTKTTEIHLYRVNEGEVPYLYELGIPVHKLLHSIEWHIDVQQKIPLPTGRDMVSEAYLKDLYAAILNNATDMIDENNSGDKWVSVALSDATKESAQHVFQKGLGTTKVYISSTVDGQANDDVMAIGGSLLKTGFLDRNTRSHLVDIGALKSAQEEFGRNTTAIALPVTMTEGMFRTKKLVTEIAYEVLGKKIDVSFMSAPDTDLLAYYFFGDGITWNVARLGVKFFDEFSAQMIGIIIHELSHDKRREGCQMTTHYSPEFLSELERIGGIIGYKGITYWMNKAGLQ